MVKKDHVGLPHGNKKRGQGSFLPLLVSMIFVRILGMT